MIRRFLPRLLGAALLLAVAFAALPALSRPADEAEKPLGKLPPDLALVPRDATFFVSVRCADLLKTLEAKALLGLPPISNEFRYLKSVLGIDPAGIERMTAVVRRGAQGRFMIVRTLKPFDAAQVRKSSGDGREMKLHGKTFRTGVGWDQDNALWVADGRTLVFGPSCAVVPYLATLARPGKTHALADELAVATGKHTATLAVLPSLMARTEVAVESTFESKAVEDRPGFKDKKVDPLSMRLRQNFEERPLKLLTLDESFGQMDRWEPVSAPFRPGMRCRRALATVDVGDGIALQGQAVFGSEAEAKDGKAGLRMALLSFREMLPALFAGKTDPRAKSLAEAIKQTQDALRNAKVSRVGKRVTASLKAGFDAKALAAYLAEQVPILTEENNLKQIGVAIHSFLSGYNYLPGDITDKAGKPLLSWRVALLPYIDKEAMYNSVKLDEPWNSKHNKMALAKMPAIFAPVKGENLEPGTTRLQMFTGPGTLRNGKNPQPSIVHISDGASNTIAVAEASKAVHWAKPTDMAVSAKALPKLGGQFPKFFHALMFDGTVRKIRRDFDEKTMRLAIDPNDGKPVDLDKLSPPK